MVGPALAANEVLGHSCVARGQNAALEAQSRAEGKRVSEMECDVPLFNNS